MSKYPKLVSWSYYSGRGVFSRKNEKEQVTKVYVLNEEGEKLLAGSKVVCLNTFRGYYDPYFKVEKITGFTRRAKNYGKLNNEMKKQYPELERKLTNVSSMLMDYVDYIYISLPYLDNYVNPLTNDKEIFLNENFIYKEKFTPEFVKTLVEYVPRALMGGEITSYRKEELPKFLSELRLSFPELYKEVLAISDVAKTLVDDITYAGKEAYLYTLNSGDVEVKINIIDKQVFYWDGNTLTNEVEIAFGNLLSQTITPNKDTIVKIVSNDTVNENTKLVN